MKRIIIAGGRDFNDMDGLAESMKTCLQGEGLTEQEVIVVCGCATGADLLGERWARYRGLTVEKYPAKWNMHGKAAGPIRNRDMALVGDILVACWDGKSRGTKNMIEEMKKLGKPIYRRPYAVKK